MTAEIAPITPWNPSRSATARVKNPLPVPERCPHCGGQCSIVGNEQIYGRVFGEWPYAVLCAGVVEPAVVLPELDSLETGEGDAH
ncbi:DUF3268 family zinc-finger domain-containing protein [Variovorax sp. LjRoot175]|uniref:hypothetical protein n=1 Tax=Variovorax sp. LjRoot175 TaxID=3342276 RepID=UPI003ECDA131